MLGPSLGRSGGIGDGVTQALAQAEQHQLGRRVRWGSPHSPSHWAATSMAVCARWILRDECHHCKHTSITCRLHWVGPHSKHNLKVEEIQGRDRDEAVLPSVITKFWQAGFKSRSFGGCFVFFFLKRFPFEGVIFSCDIAYIWDFVISWVFKSL